MAYRNGIIPSSIPFEQRCPPPRARKPERLTKTDRLVIAVCGFLLGMFLWTTSYLILITGALKAAAKHPAAAAGVDPLDRLPPYWWGVAPAVAFAIYGAVVGAEQMMDGFSTGVRIQNKVSEAVNRS